MPDFLASVSADVVGDRVLNVGAADHTKCVENVSAQIGRDVLRKEPRLLDLPVGAPVGEVADGFVSSFN